MGNSIKRIKYLSTCDFNNRNTNIDKQEYTQKEKQTLQNDIIDKQHNEVPFVEPLIAEHISIISLTLILVWCFETSFDNLLTVRLSFFAVSMVFKST